MRKLKVATSLGHSYVDGRTNEFNVWSRAAEQAALREHYKPKRSPRGASAISNQNSYGVNSAIYDCTVTERCKTGGASIVARYSVVVYAPKKRN